METPYFLISKEKLDQNINDFKSALYDIWPNSELAYSVKTNSLPWLLRYLLEKNVLAEVVSDEEYALAKQCGYEDHRIVFNGPIKGEKTFHEAITKKAFINLDSKRDLYLLQTQNVLSQNMKNTEESTDCKKAEINKLQINDRVGLRVNMNPELFASEDIGYEEDGFRFGFSDQTGEFQDALAVVQKKYPDGRIGLHLHCNSVTRSVNVYIAIAKYAADLIQKYNLKVSYIDMGGGFFGGVPGKTTPHEYIEAIKKQLIKAVDPEETMLIIEPGSAIIGSVVDLYTSVLDVKDTAHARIVTTDGSRIHIDPLWIKSRYMYSIQGKNVDKKHEKQIICGYTCMDHDRLMVIENEQELETGDQIIYHRVGAYSMTFGGMFIRYYPDVYVEQDGQLKKVRSSADVQTYVKLHS